MCICLHTLPPSRGILAMLCSCLLLTVLPLVRRFLSEFNVLPDKLPVSAFSADTCFSLGNLINFAGKLFVLYPSDITDESYE